MPPTTLAALLALLVVAPSAPALEGTGQISGTVSDTGGHPLSGIEVCATPSNEAGPGGESESCEKTTASGEFTIAGLPAGSYNVQFGAPFGGTLNYVPQFYKEASSAAGAQHVSVSAGQTTTGINARLAEGAKISGRVTDATTHAPLEVAIVCARPVSGEPALGQCAITNSGGEYTIVGLAGGNYQVAFFHGKYAIQYYNGKSALTEANAVSVTMGAVTSGIDAALTPSAAGSVLAGPLSGTPGTGAGSAPGTKTPIGGLPSGPLLTVKAVRLIALVLKHGVVSLHLRCEEAVCKGSIELTARAASRHHKGARSLPTAKTVVLARGSYTVAQGKGGVCALRLTPAGRRRLARARAHPVPAKLTVSVRGAKTTSAPALIS